MSDTALIDGPASTDIDAFLDQAIGSAADETEDASASESVSESDSPTDEQAFSDEEDDAEVRDEDGADEEEDEEPDTSDPDAEEDEDDPRVLEALRRAEEAEYALEQERAAIRQEAERLRAEQQRAATAAWLLEQRSKMTQEEWDAFSGKLLEGYQQHRDQQKDALIAQLVQQRQYEEFQAAEAQAHDTIMAHVRKQMGRLSVVEETALLNCANAEQFKATLEKIQASRKQSTEPARKALREKRRANGADRTSVRGTGGAQGVSKDYDNFNPERLDEYLDDVFASR